MDKNKRVVHEVMICMTYTNEHTFLHGKRIGQFLSGPPTLQARSDCLARFVCRF